MRVSSATVVAVDVEEVRGSARAAFVTPWASATNASVERACDRSEWMMKGVMSEGNAEDDLGTNPCFVDDSSPALQPHDGENQPLY